MYENCTRIVVGAYGAFVVLDEGFVLFFHTWLIFGSVFNFCFLSFNSHLIFVCVRGAKGKLFFKCCF